MPDIERDRRRWLVRDSLLGPCEICGYRIRRRRLRPWAAKRTMSILTIEPPTSAFNVSQDWREHSPQEIRNELRESIRICSVCRKKRGLARA